MKHSTSGQSLPILVLVLTLTLLVAGGARASVTNINTLAGDPKLRSAAVIVTDSQGKVIYGKDIDSVRSIASITKLMTAMVVLDAGLDLQQKIVITTEDRDRVQLTGSRLEIGASLSRRELLLLALMSSENRAASALSRAYPGGRFNFVDAMNKKAKSLGMSSSHFSDPAGLHVENVASASDLAKMLASAQSYPFIKEATTTLSGEVYPYRGRGPLRYANTNRLLKNNTWEIELSKTGYINEAGRCLVMRARIDGEPVSIILLNSFGKLTPFADSNRMRKWLLANS